MLIAQLYNSLGCLLAEAKIDNIQDLANTGWILDDGDKILIFEEESIEDYNE